MRGDDARLGPVSRDERVDVEAFRRFVDRNRAQCLWFLRQDYYPQTPAECLTVVRLIERHGDRRAFQDAARFRQWLSHHSSETSAGA